MAYLVERGSDEVRGLVRGAWRVGNAQAASWRLHIAMHHLAVMHMERDPEKAEQLLRRMLDERPYSDDRSEEDEKALRQAAFEIGTLVRNRGETQEADRWYETATHFGSTTAEYDLSRLLENRG